MVRALAIGLAFGVVVLSVRAYRQEQLDISLIQAIKRSDADGVEALLKYGASADTRTWDLRNGEVGEIRTAETLLDRLTDILLGRDSMADARPALFFALGWRSEPGGMTETPVERDKRIIALLLANEHFPLPGGLYRDARNRLAWGYKGGGLCLFDRESEDSAEIITFARNNMSDAAATVAFTKAGMQQFMPKFPNDPP